MTTTAQNIIAAYESLDPADRQQVAEEILRRSVGTDELTVASLDELAADVFRLYDVAEADGAND